MVDPSGIWAKAGVQVGDIIKRVDGKRVFCDIDEFLKILTEA